MSSLKQNRFAQAALVSAILGVLAGVLYAVLAGDGEKSSPLVYVLLIVGVLAQLAPAALPRLFRNDLAATFTGWAGVILFAVALVLFVTERVQWLYAILSKMEAAPLTALFPATIVAFVVAVIAAAAALFFPGGSSGD